MAYLNAAYRTIAKDETSIYINSSMQIGKGSTYELSDDFENRTIPDIKELNQRVGYNTNEPYIIYKTE